MRSRTTYALLAGCLLVLIAAGAVLSAPGVGRAGTDGIPAANLAGNGGTDGGTPANYALIEGILRKARTSSFLERKTRYKVYNTSVANTVTLGPILVFEKNGAVGAVTTMLHGTSIPPLGGIKFHLSSTGLKPTVSGDGRGPLLVAITWSGALEDCQVTGKAKDYAPSATLANHPRAVRTIEPLRVGKLTP